jgi:enoyl-CoA hydratase/carnithine racemase
MSEVLYEKKGKTAYITINRPDVLNAINYEVRAALLDSWNRVNEDSDVWSVIITGTGDKAFSVGADVKSTVKYRETAEASDLPLNSESTFGADVIKPVIAAVNGYCLGAGLLISMYSDIRVASQNAKFGLPEIKVCTLAAHGLNVRLPHYFPMCLAVEMLLLGESIDAQRAYECGYLNKLVPQSKLMSTAEEYAYKINNLSPLALMSIKRCYRIGTAISPQAIEFSDAVARMHRYTEDYKEGTRAFIQKRKPVWKGK